MKWIAQYSIGAALVVAAAALAAPQTAHAQIRSDFTTEGVGSANAQLDDGPRTSRSGVFITPNAGVNESATPISTYESSPELPSFEAELDLDKLQKAYDANQERARYRRAPRPINVPTTLGMLKDKPQAQRPKAQAQPPAPPAPPQDVTAQYLQYSPSGNAQTQTSMSAYPWTPAIVDSVLATTDASYAEQGGSDLEVSGAATNDDELGIDATATIDDELELDATAPLDNELELDATATLDEPSLADDVLREIHGAGGSLGSFDDDAEDFIDDAPDAVAPMPELQPEDIEFDDSDDSDVPDLPAFDELEPAAPSALTQPADAAPDVHDDEYIPRAVAPMPEVQPEALETDDVAAPESSAPSPNKTSPSEPAPADMDSPVAQSPLPAYGPTATPTYGPTYGPAYGPAYGPIYPSPRRVAPYAPRQDYISVGPNMTPPGAFHLPQTRGIPSQRVVGIPQRGETFSYVYEIVENDLEFANDDYATWRTGIVGGAEWLYWTTDADVSYATVSGAAGVIDGHDLESEGSGLRGRFGFRSAAGWDLIGTYTWFNQSDEGRFNADRLKDGQTLSNVRIGHDLELESITSRLKTDLQSINIDVGRVSQIGAWEFRAFGGVQWTNLNQQTTDYGRYSVASSSDDDLIGNEIVILDPEEFSDGVDEIAASGALRPGAPTLATTSALESVGVRSRLNAYGMRVGLEMRVPLANGLGIYGKGAGGLSAGRVKSTTYDAGWNPRSEFKKTYLTPSVDAGLGLSWRVNGLEARAGYEFNGWYNSGVVRGRKTDFLAHGVVAGVGYNY
ncbi:MAG: Lpg1974 family pore-forming outer membrane protein [Thermoguttaceae bacterium]|jgi:hypothetical protein